MAEQIINTHHGHPADFWTPEEREEKKKQRNRLRILLAAIGVALILLIICIVLAIASAQITGYVPTLIVELDLTPIGKAPVVLATVKLPPISTPFPEKLDFPTPTVQKDLAFDKSFSPVVNRRVEYVPVYKY